MSTAIKCSFSKAQCIFLILITKASTEIQSYLVGSCNVLHSDASSFSFPNFCLILCKFYSLDTQCIGERSRSIHANSAGSLFQQVMCHQCTSQMKLFFISELNRLTELFWTYKNALYTRTQRSSRETECILFHNETNRTMTSYFPDNLFYFPTHSVRKSVLLLGLHSTLVSSEALCRCTYV